MKKIFSLIFSLLLVYVLSTPAFAAEPEIQLYFFILTRQTKPNSFISRWTVLWFRRKLRL